MADEDLSTEEVETGAENAPENNEPEQLSEVDELAKELGWRPKSEWNGTDEEWTDSRTYLRKSREINRSLSRELKDVKKQIEGIGRATSKMTTQALARQRQELLAARDEAFEAGDKDAFKQIDEALTKLPTAEAADAADGMTSEGKEWAEKHSSWFGKDKEATDYAAKRADEYAREGLSPARQLAAVEKDMRKHFPDLFPEEKEPKAVNTPPSLARPQRTATPSPKEKGYATLPPAARKACDEWVRNQTENGNKWASKDTWAASFYEQEAANG